jgi:para-nitrobenzyl esterase
VLTDPPYEACAHRRLNDVDLLVGSNEDEAIYFLSGRDATAANLKHLLAQDFSSFIVSLIGPKPPADDRAARDAFIAFKGDMRSGWNMWAWARLHSAAAQGATYFYRFSQRPPGEEGASHGAELIHVFDRLDQKPLA